MKKAAILLSIIVSSQLAMGPAHSQETREEKLAKLLRQYPAADTNQDGRLTLDEAKSYQAKLRSKEDRRKKSRIPPTHADLKYGPHERNVIDLWLPENAADSDKPLPILVYFHGGGFVAGDKSGFNPQPFLKAGIAAASGNYRFVNGDSTLCPTPMEDATRAVQFLKSKAAEWSLDKSRFALSGGSAGAVITMWIGYRDDMAIPDSTDPVERESTRVAALMPINGPANLDPTWIRKNLGGPKHIHGSMPKMYGSDWDTPDGRERILKTSPWEFVTQDDPPTFLIYSTKLTEVPLPEDASTGELVHHPHFGVMLKTKLEKVGVPAKFVHSFDPRGSNAMTDYLKTQFFSK